MFHTEIRVIKVDTNTETVKHISPWVFDGTQVCEMVKSAHVLELFAKSAVAAPKTDGGTSRLFYLSPFDRETLQEVMMSSILLRRGSPNGTLLDMRVELKLRIKRDPVPTHLHYHVPMIDSKSPNYSFLSSENRLWLIAITELVLSRASLMKKDKAVKDQL